MYKNGVDDCGCYEVSKAKLEELLSVCKDVIENAVLKEGKISNGWKYENGERIEILEDGMYIANADIIEALLPTEGGFFFGSTDYDEYYIDKTKETIRIIEGVLKTTNFEDEYIIYTSSW